VKWACCLVLWFFASFFMCLRTFVFNFDNDSFLQGFSGTSNFTGSQKLIADFKENFSVSAFPVCKQSEVSRLFNKVSQPLNSNFEKVPQLSSQMKRLALSIRTIVHPEDSSGGVFLLTFV